MHTTPRANPGHAAAILAGGSGRRLGGVDKGALRIGGRTIVERQVQILRQVVRDVFIVADRPAPYAHLGVPIVADAIPGVGPLGGIYTALERSNGPGCLIVACDMPFLSVAFLQHLVERAGDGEEVDAVVPRTATGYHPLCAVYARRLVPIVLGRLRDARRDVTGLVAEVRVTEIGPEELAAFDPEHVLLSNVNTPQDLREACAWADRR